jgi:hypothetical protein
VIAIANMPNVATVTRETVAFGVSLRRCAGRRHGRRCCTGDRRFHANGASKVGQRPISSAKPVDAYFFEHVAIAATHRLRITERSSVAITGESNCRRGSRSRACE